MKKITKKGFALLLTMLVLLAAVVPNGIIYAQDTSGTVQTEKTSEADESGLVQELSDGESENESLSEEDTSGDDETNAEMTDEFLNGDESSTDDTDADSDGTDDTVSDEDSDNADAEGEQIPTLCYQAHIAKRGWLSSVSGGQTAGTTGQSLQLEAITVSLENVDSEKWAGSGITYSAHVRKIGWQSSVSNGQTAGTTGQSLQIEAVKIELTGSIAEEYDVYYRVHSQTYGWLDWAKNGEIAGSVGYAKRAEAIEIVLVKKGEAAPGSTDKSCVYSRVNCWAHSQTIGWQSVVKEGEISGTTGQAKRLEALKLQLSSELEYSGSIEYQVYVQKYGWMDWKSDGEIAGTTGEAKRIEAIRIRLTGDIANYYDVYYSVHMAKIGWSGYACNGAVAGTIELSKRLEAVKVVLVKKGVDSAPDTSGTKYVEGHSSGDFSYSAQIKGAGSTGTVVQGATIGMTDSSAQLQNITLNLKNSTNSPSGTIQYTTHISKTGWTGWSTAGTSSGSDSSSYGIEAVKIQLTGDLAKYYDIYYRAYVEEYGWLGWAKNGQTAGTTGISYRLGALQILLVSKDCAAPGANTGYYMTQKKVTVSDTMHAKAMQYSSSTQYLIMVDRDAHKVGIFTGSKGQWTYVYLWDCANGKASTPTVGGVFTVKSKGYYFDSGSSRCYWYTQFYGNYLFHSVLYNKNGTLQDGRVGMALSHGCVRLLIENAKWIYDNVPYGTTVVVY